MRFWQNDRGLLRATAVTLDETDTEEESAQKVNSGEENSPAASAGIRTRNLSTTSTALYQQAIQNSDEKYCLPVLKQQIYAAAKGQTSVCKNRLNDNSALLG